MRARSQTHRLHQPRVRACFALFAFAVVLFLSAVPVIASSSCFARVMSPSECANACFANSARAAALANPGGARSTLVMQNAQMPPMKGMAMPSDPATDLLMNEASGTSMNPMSSPIQMRMVRAGKWNLGFMANGFITDTQQSGPRGADKLYSASVFMGTAQHSVGRGSFLFDVMLSAEPATISEREYPLLFQTGETAFGSPIENGQHPHNFVMALGLHYAHPAGDNTVLEAYFAPVGDPALGPVAFPHRASAAELPEAPIGHHWEDSSHIAYEVATVGVKHKIVRLEVSGFHGAEPNENRWNIATGAMDSWAARFSIYPTPNWAAQVSVGRLTHPEALQPGDTVRTTASVSYSRPMGGADWATSFVFGRNHSTMTGRGTNAFLLESVVPFRTKNYFTGRWEMVDKDELFAAEPALQQQLASTVGDTFRIDAYTLGYTRYVRLWSPIETGFGANFSAYTLPPAITPFYGEHPFGVNVYLHFRLKPKGQ